MPRIVRKKQRRAGGNRAKSAFQNECQHALILAKTHQRYFLPLGLIKELPPGAYCQATNAVEEFQD